MSLTPTNTFLVTGSTNTTLTTSSFTPSTNDIIVVKALSEDGGSVTMATPTATGGGITWTLRQSNAVANNCGVWLWTGIVTSGGTAITVSSGTASGSGMHSMMVERWDGSTCKLAASPVSVKTIQSASGTATTTITTAANGSAVSWCDGDWNAVAPGTPTYANSATQEGIDNKSPSNYVAYYAYQQAATAGSQTFGVTSPTGQKGSLVGIEIQAAGGTNYTASPSDAENITDSASQVQNQNAYAENLSFTDDYETGNTSKWDSVVVGTSGSITVDGASAYQGSFGLHIQSANPGGATYVRKNIPAADHVMAEAEMQVVTDPGSGNNSSGLRFFSSGTRIADCYVQGTNLQFWLRYRDNTNTYRFLQVGTGTATIGTWFKYRLEVIYTAGANSTINVWVNDVQQLNATGLNLWSGSIDSFQHGHETASTFADTRWDNTTVWTWQPPVDPVGITDSVSTSVFTAYTQSPADAENITDALAQVQQQFLTPADPENITDVGAAQQDMVRSQADPVGLTDSVSVVQNQFVAPADNVGVADTGSPQQALVRGPADALGITDSQAQVQSQFVTASDAVGITDAGSGVLNSGGTNYTASPADAVGLTDSVSIVQTQFLTAADSVGITDASAPVQALQRAAGDSVGIADAQSQIQNQSVTPSDALGITDVAGNGTNYTQNPADPEGITDSASVVQSQQQAAADPVGLSDAASVVQSQVQSPSDPVGLADSAALAQSQFLAPSETVNLTDAAAVVQQQFQSPSDPVGVSDAASVVQSQFEAPADSVGLTDAATSATGFGQFPADAVGLTDSVSVVQNQQVVAADNIGIFDAAGNGTLYSGNPSDPIGISDAASATQDQQQAFSDQFGITDTATSAAGVNQAASDAVGLTDSLSTTAAVNQAYADPEGLTDAYTTSVGFARTASDPVGLSDTASTAAAVFQTLADAAGISDSASVVVVAYQAPTETVGITDTCIATIATPNAAFSDFVAYIGPKPFTATIEPNRWTVNVQRPPWKAGIE